MIYSPENVGALVGRIQTGEIPDYKAYYWKKLRTSLQVHTEGRLYEKVHQIFRNEPEESTKFIINSYESVTKSSIWRGIDALSRIFNSTGFDVTGDPKTIESLAENSFFTKYIEDFISISTSRDPNSVQVWMKDKEGEWVSRFIETEFIQLITPYEIAFIDIQNSDYTISVDHSKIGSIAAQLDYGQKISTSYYEGVVYKFGPKIRYIYISQEQYLEIDADGKQAEVRIENFKEPITWPYTFTGTEKLEKGIYNSPMSPFIPFGNHALIQHRTYRSVEALFSYPRLAELEMPCDQCVRGQVTCDPCDEYPSGLMPCKDCNGSGYLSLQSPFKIYKRKIFPDAPELNANIKPVEFFTPDIGILNYNADAWRKTLQMGEDAIYIQQRVETGNVESAASREKQMESMYAWLGRISSVIYSNIQKALDNYAILNGTGPVVVNRPMSFAIMSEIEAFQYLNMIVSTDSPAFIKSTHIENFLNKYVSKTSPIIKVVDVLKRVDPFVFYTLKDMQALSDSGVIADNDWRIHAYAYPVLMQMVARNPELLEGDISQIDSQLSSELNRNQPITTAQQIREAAQQQRQEDQEEEDEEDDQEIEG